MHGLQEQIFRRIMGEAPLKQFYLPNCTALSLIKGTVGQLPLMGT
jgi:hypothetical protein